jgi:protein SFI1
VPTNALFNAYYALLPSIGIDTDHDSRYARILFKIGGTRSSGSLFEKFEAVLLQMGIELEFDDELHYDKAYREEPNEQADQGIIPISREILASKPPNRLRRRNSESSTWDIGKHFHMERHSRIRSQSPVPEVERDTFQIHGHVSVSSIQRKLETFDRIENKPRHIGHGQQLQERDEKDFKTRLKYETVPNDVSADTRPIHGGMHIRRRSAPSEYDSKTTSTWHSSNDIDVANVSHVQPALALESDDSDAKSSSNKHVTDPDSETLIHIKISLLDQYRTKNLLRHVLTQWRQFSLQFQEDNRSLGLLATHQDKKVLLRQAFDSWRSNLKAREQASETERFFEHLEGRTDWEREKFIRAKACLHWAATARFERQRTSAARWHFLRARYFDTWRDYTVINELKVRRQVLRKFFPIWQHKYIDNSRGTVEALTVFDDNLARRVFLSWLRSLQEEKAIVWCATRVKGVSLTKWLAAFKCVKEIHAESENHHRLVVINTVLLAWTTKSHQYARYGHDAESRRKHFLSVEVFRRLGLEYSLCSPAHHLEAVVSQRLKQRCLAMWVHQSRQEVHAAAHDCYKIKHEALVAWNDKLRCHIILARTKSRLLHRGFRVWMLTERAILIQRLRDRNLARGVLQKMLEASEALVARETRDSCISEELYRRTIATKALLRWQAYAQSLAQHRTTAYKFTSPTGLSHPFAKWARRTQQITRMQKWALDGEFYFIANNNLKRWKSATENLKRQKRRAAYVHIHRKNKVNLATNVFSVWYSQVKAINDMGGRATEVYSNKKIVFGLEIFDHWRGHAQDITGLDVPRKDFQSRKLLGYLKISLAGRRNKEREADIVFKEREITISMKKWARAALQIRASQHVVSELCEKHNKKTLRRILAHWYQRISSNPTFPDLSKNNTYGEFLDLERDQLGVTQRAEAWSEFGEDPGIEEWSQVPDHGTSPMPVPGYLSTPSKKMSRIRSLGRLSSTTPVAPLSTPFEKHLRAQYLESSQPSFKRGPGKINVGKNEQKGANTVRKAFPYLSDKVANV